MVPAPLSTGFQSFSPLPTIKLGPSGAGSRVGGLVHTLGPCGSLQRPLLRGWESLFLTPQPPWAFSIRGLRLYFPALEPWVTRSALLPAVCPVSLCTSVGSAGSASGQTACPIRPTLSQSRSRHSQGSPLHPGARLRPYYRSGCTFLFIYLVSDFLAVRFSVSSGCARRRSVSIYTAILVRGPYKFFSFSISSTILNLPLSILCLPICLKW